MTYYALSIAFMVACVILGAREARTRTWAPLLAALMVVAQFALLMSK
jgi:hypothetical protein